LEIGYQSHTYDPENQLDPTITQLSAIDIAVSRGLTIVVHEVYLLDIFVIFMVTNVCVTFFTGLLLLRALNPKILHPEMRRSVTTMNPIAI
jgi:hypothetical protein